MPIKFYKNLGETSFQCVERFRKENPEYQDQKIAFAGRLDPMAEGEMLFLTGEETKRKDDFLGLDKIYETEIIFGLETDSFDVMGMTREIKNLKLKTCLPAGKVKNLEEKIKEIILTKVGKQMQKFPPFSKRHVKGKALFVWASEGKLDQIEIPEHEVEIYSIDILGFSQKSFEEIKNNSIERIKNVMGDFRQEKIIGNWNNLSISPTTQFPILKLKIFCSTGTYIRQFAHDLGQELGCGAIVFSIKRLEVLKK